MPSVADLSNSTEVLTDIDVVGVATPGDGGLRRTIFDCKTTNKLSSINRAFWARGLMDYVGCDDAFVILKNKAVHNQRLSALSIRVDLHTEESFNDLGRTIDPAFPADTCYQASLVGWNATYEATRLTPGPNHCSIWFETPSHLLNHLGAYFDELSQRCETRAVILIPRRRSTLRSCSTSCRRPSCCGQCLGGTSVISTSQQWTRRRLSRF